MVVCSKETIAATLESLQSAGHQRRECVVFWLGQRVGDVTRVVHVYQPAHVAKEDMFHIPQQSMTVLHAELRKNRLMVAAQIHSHPREAFHSRADDNWAIVRHENALSLVVPDFALRTDVARFMKDTKVYRFSASAHWTEVPEHEGAKWLQVL